MMSLLVACCLAHATAHTAPPARPALLTLRGGSASKVAAGLNGAVLFSYGSALVLDPKALAKNVMDSDAPPEFGDIGYAFGQYLGCAYLTQSILMLRAFNSPETAENDLKGVTILQGLLCLTSIARLVIGNLPRNSVTLTLPMGQGLMALIGLWGARSASK